MKNINNLFLLLAAIVYFASSSGKDGAVGPGRTTVADTWTKHVDLSA